MPRKRDRTRREFVGDVAVLLGVVAGGGLSVRAEGGVVESGQDYGYVRGFNYQPSYGSHGLEIWGDGFDLERIREELLRGRRFFPGMNTIRLWLSYDAFVRQPGAMPDRFHRVVDLAEVLGVRFVPTLFNGWHSCPDFGGISVEMLGYWGAAERFADAFGAYLDAVVKPHAADVRILLWDLCNEPFNSAGCDESKRVVVGWLERVRGHCKALGVRAPLSVGSVPSLDAMRWVEPLSDVLTFHPYYAWNAWMTSPEAFEAFLDEALAFGKSAGKPMLVTETGWGALDDKKRAETLAVELGALKERGLGFVVHLLHHTLVADGHRPEYGPISGAGYMAFLEKDGTLRPHHEVFNAF